MPDTTPPETQTDPQDGDARSPEEIRRDTLLQGQNVSDDADETPPPETPPADTVTASQGDDTVSAGDSDDAGVPEGFLDQLQVLGFDDVQDEDEGRQRLLEGYALLNQQTQQLQNQYQQLQPLANYGQEYLRQLQDPAYQEFQKQRQTGSPAPQQQEQANQDWWTPPEVDLTSIERYRETRVDQDGRTVHDWKPDTPPQIRASGEAYAAYRDKWLDDLANRPHEVLPKIIEAEFNRLFEKTYGDRVQEERQLAVVDQLERENAEWLYQKDPRTNQFATDPATGQYLPTPAGEAMFRYMEEARTDGLSDPSAIWKHAYRALQSDPAISQHQQEQRSENAKQVKTQKQMEHLRRGASSVDRRGGSVPQAETEKQNEHFSPGQALLASLQADGVV